MVLIKTDLLKDEKIFKEIKISRWSVSLYYFFSLILIIFSFISIWIIIISIFLVIIAEMRVNGTRYYITNKRIIYDYQFIEKKRISLKFTNIQDLEVNQDLFDRILGLGSVNLDTSGQNKVELEINYIPEPYEIKKLIDNIIHDSDINTSGEFSCSECGEIIGNNSKFCPSCGASFENENECFKCKFKNKDKAKFCENCGEKLKK